MLSRQAIWPSVHGSAHSWIPSYQLAMVLAGHLASRVGSSEAVPQIHLYTHFFFSLSSVDRKLLGGPDEPFEILNQIQIYCILPTFPKICLCKIWETTWEFRFVFTSFRVTMLSNRHILCIVACIPNYKNRSSVVSEIWEGPQLPWIFNLF